MAKQLSHPLTDKEKMLLACAARDLTHKQIAELLHLSPDSISIRMHTIYLKLGLLSGGSVETALRQALKYEIVLPNVDEIKPEGEEPGNYFEHQEQLRK